jgi:hypothetical protein
VLLLLHTFIQGQRISTSKLKKGATPDVKVHNLAGINKLSNDIQQQLLQEVIDGTYVPF